MGNRWGNSGNSIRLYFLGFKITADGACSLDIKRHLLLGRKVITKLDSILKSRDIILPTKVRLDVLIASITRGSQTEIPHGNSMFNRGDTLVVVTSGRGVIKQINDIFA